MRGLELRRSRGDADVAGLADQRIHVVRNALVIEQLADRGRQPKLHVVVDFVLPGAEAGTTQQVLDHVLAVPDTLALDGVAFAFAAWSGCPAAKIIRLRPERQRDLFRPQRTGKCYLEDPRKAKQIIPFGGFP